MTENERHLLSGAYALNALSPSEAREFEEALTLSPELAREAKELRETAIVLALATEPVQPSEGLKASLMAKIAADAPDARADRDVISTSTAAVIPTASTQNPSTPEAPAASAADASAVDASSTFTSRAEARAAGATQKANLRWFTRPVTLLAAAAAAVALFVGGSFVGTALSQQGTSANNQASAANSLAELYSASDLKSTRASIAGGGEATVLFSASLGRSAIVAQGLASLPSDKTYEAWYINGTSITPAGTFTPGGDATTWHVLSGALNSGDTVGLSIEPAGGSQSPTTTPILAVPSNA